MSQPIRINLASADFVDPEWIAAHAERGTHVVLRFPLTLDAASKNAVVQRLAGLLPEHSVFDSAGDRMSTWVTVMPVVPRDEVLGRRAEVERAMKDYQDTCALLTGRYRHGSLTPEWEAIEHGGECRFENARTGQVVEAPYEEWLIANSSGEIDPYFFAIFVRTTPAHERVAALIKEAFHDAARILEVISSANESTHSQKQNHGAGDNR